MIHSRLKKHRVAVCLAAILILGGCHKKAAAPPPPPPPAPAPAPALLPTANITVNPSVIDQGQSGTLEWKRPMPPTFQSRASARLLRTAPSPSRLPGLPPTRLPPKGLEVVWRQTLDSRSILLSPSRCLHPRPSPKNSSSSKICRTSISITTRPTSALRTRL